MGKNPEYLLRECISTPPPRRIAGRSAPASRCAAAFSLSRNDSLDLYGVRGQSAAATPLCFFYPPTVAYAKQFLQSESVDGAPSSQGRGLG